MTVLQPPATMAPTMIAASPGAVRRIAGAVSLPLVFVLLIVGNLSEPIDYSAPYAQQQQALAGNETGMGFAVVLQLIAAGVMVAVILAIAGRTRGRGRIAAGFAVPIAVVGAISMVMTALHGLFQLALLPQTADTAAAVLGHLDELVGPAFLVLLFTAPVGLFLLALASWRAGFMPLPAFILAAAFLAGEFVPVLPMGELIPVVLGLISFGWTAVVLILRRA